jgi:hypothetical protein
LSCAWCCLTVVLPRYPQKSDEHGFGFSVLWNSFHPDRVSLSMHSYTLDAIAAEAPGRSTSREKVPLGGAVRLELIA